MAITLRMCGATVLFPKQRQGRRGALLKFPVLHPHGGESYERTFEHALELPTPAVGCNDFKMWFVYLISGFRDSCRPPTQKLLGLKQIA